jgi:hypothetical protein
MKCSFCSETFGCDGPDSPGPVFCSEECERAHQDGEQDGDDD